MKTHCFQTSHSTQNRLRSGLRFLAKSQVSDCLLSSCSHLQLPSCRVKAWRKRQLWANIKTIRLGNHYWTKAHKSQGNSESLPVGHSNSIRGFILVLHVQGRVHRRQNASTKRYQSTTVGFRRKTWITGVQGMGAAQSQSKKLWAARIFSWSRMCIRRCMTTRSRATSRDSSTLSITHTSIQTTLLFWTWKRRKLSLTRPFGNRREQNRKMEPIAVRKPNP